MIKPYLSGSNNIFFCPIEFGSGPQNNYVANGAFWSQPGLFAWDRIDTASALLAQHLPTDFGGAGADLGAGFGYLSRELLAKNPGIASLDLYEADLRAVALARRNVVSDRVPLGFEWHDVTRGLPCRYDFVVTNPPFHGQSRIERPELGQRFIEVAGEAVRGGGRLWLVANRHLPYEAVLASQFRTVRTVAQEQGFKVIEAVKAGT